MTELKITAPKRCLSCGKKTKNMTKDHSWTGFPVAGVKGIYLFICPKCDAVYSNPEAIENTKIVNEATERRVQPAGQKDLIKLTGGERG